MIELAINGQPLPAAGEVEIEPPELQEWSHVEITAVPVAGASAAQLQLGGQALGAPTTTPFDPTWRWQWQPGGIAGLVQGELLITTAAGQLQRRFTLRLLPRAIDRQTYAELLSAIQQVARALALRLGGQALERAALLPVDAEGRSLLEEALALLRRHGGMLARCLERIAAQPQELLRPQPRRRRLAETGDWSQVELRDLTREPLEPAGEIEEQSETLAALQALTGGPLPASLTSQQSRPSYDLPEHRFASWLVAEIARRARLIRGLAEAALPHQAASIAAAEALSAIAAECELLTRTMDQLRQKEPLAGLPARPRPPRSQLLYRDRRYRPLLQVWQELRAAPLLVLDVPQLLLPLAELPALYEAWSALSTCLLLMDRGTLQAQHLLAPTADGWALRLGHDAALLELRSGQRSLRLRYQPRYQPGAAGFGSLDRYLRIPDLSLEVEDGATRWLLILDAKYRLAPDGYVPQEALDDAYAYKGSLGYAGQPCVRYAALLYPGRGAAEDYGGVGSLPHLPDQTRALHALLSSLLEQAEHPDPPSAPPA